MRAVRALLYSLAVVIAIGVLREHVNLRPLLLPAHLVRLSAQPPDDTLLMPVAGLHPKKAVSTWHAPRPGGRRHEGQDIFAAKGTPVVSATRGVVVRTGTGGLGGNAVWIFGAGGRSYYYAHLSRFADNLNIGDSVEPGTVIGYVGNTGNARTTPPHLHFGIYSPSGAIDPAPLLAG